MEYHIVQMSVAVSYGDKDPGVLSFNECRINPTEFEQAPQIANFFD